MRIGHLFAALLSICLVSCFEIEETIELERNGSGKFTMVMDMSKLMSNEMMVEMLKSSKDDSSPGIPKQDTMIYGRDMAPAEKTGDPDLWNRMKMRLQSDEDKGILKATMMLDFKNVGEIGIALKNFDKLNKEKSSEDNGFGGFMPSTLSYVLDGKTLTRTSMMPKQEEDMEMATMFMEDAVYRVIYKLPSKARKVNMHKEAAIEEKGSVVKIEMSLKDIITGSATLNGSVRY